MFVLSSEITIGKFKFSGVNEVQVKRSIHSVVDTATIKLPTKAHILKKGRDNTDSIVTAQQFQAGDKVTIKLGYDDSLAEEFRGFVVQVSQDTPITVDCEGYSFQLKNKNVSGSWSKPKLKDLVDEIVKGTDIKVEMVSGSDIEFVNVRADNKTGFEMLDMVLKATGGSVDAWFVEPDKLKVGLVYVPAGDELKYVLQQEAIKYRINYNAIQSNDLKVKVALPVTVVVKNAESKRDRNANTVTDQKIKNYVLNHISKAALQKIKDTLKLKQSYNGYEGKLTAFLRPLCYPGCTATITDSRYKDRNGDYLIESVEVNFGSNGARRTVEVGPKLSAAR
jgi:hypothetical protein